MTEWQIWTCVFLGIGAGGRVDTMSHKAQELAAELDTAHRGHSDEGPSAFSEAATMLRTQDTLLRQALEALDIWGNAAPDVQQDAIEAITEHLK